MTELTNSPPTRYEILKMAREIVTGEYTDKRAQDHNKWLADSDVAWKTQRIKLPYPEFPPFPNENIIVERAKILVDFIFPPDYNNDSNSLPKQLHPPKPPGPPPDDNKNMLDELDEYKKLIAYNHIDEYSSSSSEMIPSVVKKIEEVKRDLILK